MNGIPPAAKERTAPLRTFLPGPFTILSFQSPPPGALLRYPLRTDEQIGRIRGPLLLLHGERDTLIPPSHSEALRARAPRARLVLVPGGGHNDLQLFDSYLNAVSDALRAL